jgi:hypothetical protein
MRAIRLNCTLKRSPEKSGTASLSDAEILVVAAPTWIGQPSSEWSITTGQTAARNLLAVARALQAHPIPAPPS